jgi:hypothetical protein
MRVRKMNGYLSNRWDGGARTFQPTQISTNRVMPMRK